MKAIILAAGRGSRMENMTDDRPKCLVQLKGKTLLDRQLDALRGAGVSDIAIVTGYKRELLQNFNLTEFHNSRWSETNMVASLMTAHEWLANELCIVSYSDIFYDKEAVESLAQCLFPLAITYDSNWLNLWQKRFSDPLVDAETFRLNTSNTTLAEIGNKPKTLDEIEGQYMGLLKFTPAGWQEMYETYLNLNSVEQDEAHMTGMLQKIVQRGEIFIGCVPYNQKWGEVDSISDLECYL